MTVVKQIESDYTSIRIVEVINAYREHGMEVIEPVYEVERLSEGEWKFVLVRKNPYDALIEARNYLVYLDYKSKSNKEKTTQRGRVKKNSPDEK